MGRVVRSQQAGYIYLSTTSRLLILRYFLTRFYTVLDWTQFRYLSTSKLDDESQRISSHPFRCRSLRPMLSQGHMAHFLAQWLKLLIYTSPFVNHINFFQSHVTLEEYASVEIDMVEKVLERAKGATEKGIELCPGDPHIYLLD